MDYQHSKQSTNKIYPTEFRGHVAAFLESLKFNLNDKRLIISVSAGVDSIALLDVMARLPYKNLEILHFNHGTRILENQKEEELIFDLAKKYKLPLHIKKLEFDLSASNFEYKARIKRQGVYQGLIAEGAWVLCAHHINDSFEWSLMQSFKQSGLVTSLGIPVFNQGLLRPFMCVTKKQILKYAKLEGLQWIEDSSNEDTRFERNALRKNIASEILHKYPKALKHYVRRQNLLAQKLGVHFLNVKKKDLILKRDSLGRISLKADEFKSHKDEIKAAIFELSNTNRGQLDEELEKFLKLQSELRVNPKVLSVKGPHRGPINFAGAVSGFIYKDEMMFLNKILFERSLELDQKLVSYLESSEITHDLYLDLFPYLLITKGQKTNSGSKFIHPLLPKTCHWLKENNISYTFDSNFHKKSEQNLASSALLLDSSRLGL